MTEEEKEAYKSIVRIYGHEEAEKMFELAKAFANAGMEKEGK